MEGNEIRKEIQRIKSIGYEIISDKDYIKKEFEFDIEYRYNQYNGLTGLNFIDIRHDGLIVGTYNIPSNSFVAFENHKGVEFKGGKRITPSEDFFSGIKKFYYEYFS